MGCTGEPVTIETGDTGELTTQDCSPALQISASSNATQRYGLVQFTATGGTGNYRFTLETKENGSSIEELTGTYVAGGGDAFEETIWVHDAECEGAASTTIQITAPFTIEPESLTIAPNTSFMWRNTRNSISI